MTDGEFIFKAIEILNRNGCQDARVCNPPDTDTIYLGTWSYMTRSQLVAVAEEIMHLLTKKKAADEGVYTLQADAFTCGMLMGLIEKEGIQSDMRAIWDQLVDIKKQVEKEEGVVKEVIGNGLLRITDRDGNIIIRPPYSFEVGGN